MLKEAVGRLDNSNIVQFFLELRFLLSKTQVTLDMTSKFGYSVLGNRIRKRKIFILKNFTMQKFVKGGAFGFLKIQFVVKLKGDFLETLKNFQKKSHRAKKRKRG